MLCRGCIYVFSAAYTWVECTSGFDEPRSGICELSDVMVRRKTSDGKNCCNDDMARRLRRMTATRFVHGNEQATCMYNI
jgi:hypothetical protein